MNAFGEGDWRRGAPEGERSEGEKYPLAARDVAELRDMFTEFAAGGEKLTASSLRDVSARALGVRMPLDKCAEAISLWSDRGDMGFDEFLAFYASSLKGTSSADELRGVFHMLKSDPRNNGVPARTVAAALCELSGVGEKQVRRMFREAFPGRDTREMLAGASLTFEEFSQLMR